ncbi:nuclease-related domain-containing protein [Cytobacillus purgationiresistens]|uniref:NERD domain-containing protein n=1 Tax=Cytobacillus purgationiresistens TaxID=863449 RepID=A0ABU0ABZ2_9BACI|nr:nuclease-related domain-containing protein [Cytobacillus purgationiresistens]MDQ0268312.1 hypothetical protein [Cytobacillus purgationiresistens]
MIIPNKELLIMRQLVRRMHLESNEQHYVNNLEKGFEGEAAFCEKLSLQSNKAVILHDLLLEINQTIFQIDFLILYDKLYHLEVKNYEGDFYVDKDCWFSISG